MMHFDDRLETVLRLPAMGKAFARIQYRQLIDLLGSCARESECELSRIDAAYRQLAELSGEISTVDQARMIASSHSRLRSPRLVAMLVEGSPDIASAAISAAQLSERQWLELIPSLPVRARGILRHRRDLGPQVEGLLNRLGIRDRGLPPGQASANDDALDLAAFAAPGEAAQVVLSSTDNAASDAGTDVRNDIARLRRRVEEFNRTRRGAITEGLRRADAPRLPLGDHFPDAAAASASVIDFETDRACRIVRADARFAPAVVGLSLTASEAGGAMQAPAELAMALRHRQPLENVPIALLGAPAISGDWRIDAVPRFASGSGGFTGYAGRLRRPGVRQDSEEALDPLTAETDRMRQILHELRTPANAMQMSAEVIQQTMLGPVHHAYRAIAAMIASDTAYVIAGFDELERLAKLEGGSLELDKGTSDLCAVARSIIENLQAYTDGRDSGFALEQPDGTVGTRLAEPEIERLLWRLLAVLAGASAPNEHLGLTCKVKEGQAIVMLDLPAKLSAFEAETLFEAGPDTAAASNGPSAGMFGPGFSLRLARAEAKAAGGSLQRDGNQLRLLLPALPADLVTEDQN